MKTTNIKFTVYEIKCEYSCPYCGENYVDYVETCSDIVGDTIDCDGCGKEFQVIDERIKGIYNNGKI